MKPVLQFYSKQKLGYFFEAALTYLYYDLVCIQIYSLAFYLSFFNDIYVLYFFSKNE
jgi:hypothetical protein